MTMITIPIQCPFLLRELVLLIGASMSTLGRLRRRFLITPPMNPCRLLLQLMVLVRFGGFYNSCGTVDGIHSCSPNDICAAFNDIRPCTVIIFFFRGIGVPTQSKLDIKDVLVMPLDSFATFLSAGFMEIRWRGLPATFPNRRDSAHETFCKRARSPQ